MRQQQQVYANFERIIIFFYFFLILSLYLPFSLCFAITENKMARLKSVEILQEACLKSK
jgi:hypothetical protein